jgi:MerR family mercuric resistance operon transcriptional regulator
MLKQHYTIGQLAKAAGIGVETIRYYQRRHLLTVPDKEFGSVRNYSIEFVERLQFIKNAKELGFTLDEIGSLLLLNTKIRQLNVAPCDDPATQFNAAHKINPTVRHIAHERLIQVRQKMDELKKIEHSLDQLIRQCERTEFTSSCPIVDALSCKLTD